VLKSIKVIENKVEIIEYNFDKLKLPDTLKTTVTNPVKIDNRK
jgi:hypothetical protein